MSNEKLSVHVYFPEQTVLRSVEKNVKRVQKVLDAQILKDSNFHCPMDTSNLQKSGILHTVVGSGRVVWDTPYAKKQYNNWKGGRFSRNKNPHAQSKWFEVAKAKKLHEWEKLVNDEYRKGN